MAKRVKTVLKAAVIVALFLAGRAERGRAQPKDAGPEDCGSYCGGVVSAGTEDYEKCVQACLNNGGPPTGCNISRF